MNVDTARARADLRKRIVGCQKCGLRAAARSPVPFRGPTPAEFAVVGEGPGKAEDEQGKPFVGAAGRLLKSLLAEHLQVDLDTEVFVANVVACRPPGNRTPTQPEVKSCNQHLQDQLLLSQAKWVILLGATALKSFRPDALITRIHGRPFFLETTYFFPTFHPAAIFRDRTLQKVVEQDLERLSYLAMSEEMQAAVGNLEAKLGDMKLSRWPEDCEKCGKPVHRYSQYGIPYCQKCWERNVKITNVSNQRGLF